MKFEPGQRFALRFFPGVVGVVDHVDERGIPWLVLNRAVLDCVAWVPTPVSPRELELRMPRELTYAPTGHKYRILANELQVQGESGKWQSSRHLLRYSPYLGLMLTGRFTPEPDEALRELLHDLIRRPYETEDDGSYADL